MTPPWRCTRTGARPLTGGRLPRPARHATSGAPRRTLPSLAVAAAVVAGISAAASTTPVQAAGWTNSASKTIGQLSMATMADSSWLKIAGTGTVNATTYSISGVLTGATTGYVDLVNNATVPATLTLTMSMGNLVGATPASVCPQQWDTATGACPVAATTIGTTVVLGTATPGYTSPLLPPGGHVHLKVSIGGVIGSVTLTRSTVTPRSAADRTSS